MIKINNIQQFKTLITERDALIAYFTTPACNVCKVLKPKILKLLESDFPLIEFADINSEEFPDIAAQFSVFTAPTIVVFFNGFESFRKARYIGINELSNYLKRPYNLLFN